MPDFPQRGRSIISTLRGSGTYFATVTSGWTANTLGSWVELTPGLPYAVDSLDVSLFTGTVNSDMLVDIGIGASGSEVVLVNSLYNALGTDAARCSQYRLPIKLPAGTRIAARSRSNVANNAVGVVIYATASETMTVPGSSVVATYGATTGSSRGTSLDSGGTANTYGAWTQITASTLYESRWISIGVASGANYSLTDADRLLDIGIGESGSEVALLEGLYMRDNSGADVLIPGVWTFDVAIPQGVRLSARTKCSITNATDRKCDVVLYCG